MYSKLKRNSVISANLGLLAIIAKIVLTIVLKVKGMLDVGVFMIVIICVTSLIPFGSTIAFIICKCTNVLSVSWWWVLLTITVDFIVLRTWIDTIRLQNYEQSIGMY